MTAGPGTHTGPSPEPGPGLVLYGYWRSSASYRARIALNLKGLDVEHRFVHLLRDGGQQNQPDYRALNPEGRVPLLVDGDFRLGQSLAILRYLEDRFPAAPRLVPADPRLAARMWQFCEAINADTQPLMNIGVTQYLERCLGVDEAGRAAWLKHWIERALVALEAETADLPLAHAVFGDTPTLADCCLVPQVFAARRFGADLELAPRLAALAARLDRQPAFASAAPAQQADAVPA